MKRLSLLFVMLGFVLLATNTTQAQNYRNGIGLRLGWDYGITFKHFVNETAAIEGILTYRRYGSVYENYGYNYLRVTGLYLIHNPIGGAPGLSWYFGGGIMFQSLSGDYFDYDTKAKRSGFGIVGALGLDYKFENTPLNLSIDWLPTFIIGGYGDGFAGNTGALAIRYTF